MGTTFRVFGAVSALAAVGLASYTGASPVERNMLRDVYNVATDETNQEKQIRTVIAGQLATKVYVRCADMPLAIQQKDKQYGYEHYGITYPKRPGLPWAIRLTPKICNDVTALAGRKEAFEDQQQLKDTANAVEAVAHEGVHAAKDIRDERVAKCYGIQLMEEAAVKFGASSEVADQLQQQSIAVWETSSLKQYTPLAECADGKALDLKPDVPDPWGFPAIA